MTATVSRFEARVAPCRRVSAGEQFVTEDLQGLTTADLRYDCGCRESKEEFHDGSVHHLTMHHNGKVLVDEEFRGE